MTVISWQIFLVWFFLFSVSEGPLFWTGTVLEALKGHSSAPALITSPSFSVTQAPVCIPLCFCSAAFGTTVSAGEPEGLTCLVPSYKRLFESINLAMSFSSALLRPKLTDCECWLLSTPGCKNLRKKGRTGDGGLSGIFQGGSLRRYDRYFDLAGSWSLDETYTAYTTYSIWRLWSRLGLMLAFWGSKSELLIEYISHHIRA